MITELMNIFKRKRENKKKNIFQLKEVHYKVRLEFLETRITHVCCSTDILFGSTISEPSLESKIPSQNGIIGGHKLTSAEHTLRIRSIKGT